MALRILFLGTPSFAVPTLERLQASPHTIVGVVTQPDRPRGRGRKITAEAVKRAAVEHGLTVLQPERLRDPALVATLAETAPDLGVVAAYGRLLPDALLALPRLGMINVHASLLPRWRGAAPVHRAILAGDDHTGVTIMRVVRRLDAGPVLSTAATPIDADETSVDLERRLARMGADLLVETVDRLAQGEHPEREQDESRATHAPRLERRDGDLDWAQPARAVHDRIRGLHPWPHAAAVLGERPLILLRATVASAGDSGQPPGTILATGDEGIDVATAPGAVRITRLQLPGRAPVDAAAYLRGHPLADGDRFGPPPTAR